MAMSRRCGYTSALPPMWKCQEEVKTSGYWCIFHDPSSHKDPTQVQTRIAERLEDTNEEILRFDGAVFPQGVGFQGMVFNKPVYFYQARFVGSDTQFDGAIFEGSVVSFERATFEAARTSFIQSGFSPNTGVNFSWVIFASQDTNFSHAEFKGGHTSFVRARFHGRTVFRGIEPQHIFLGKFTSFEWMTVEGDGRVTFDWADLSRVSFLNANLRNVEFLDVKWAKGGWRLRVHDEELWFEKHRDPKKRAKANLEDLPRLAHLYRSLKNYYREAGEHRLVGHFHAGLMEVQWNQKEAGGRGKGLRNWLKQKFKKWVSWEALYRVFSGYGEDYALAGRWVLLFLLFFATLYWLLGVPSSPVNDTWGFWERGLHSALYSLQAATLWHVNFYREQTFELGVRYLQLAESIVVPIQFGFLILALRNRFHR